jgi:uncharacterized membrane protein YgaE (UPF0421/DUF939 family)
MDDVVAAPGRAATRRDAARRVVGRVQPRQRFALGRARVRESSWGVAQSAVGGSLAWLGSERLLNHPSPVFATVAAIVCLSTSHTNRLRRVVEMGLGVALGVFVGDVIAGVIGRGALQLGLIVLLGMTLALLIDGGGLIVNQAALQAVFVMALPPPTGGLPGRWFDALLGGAVALAVAFVAPANPLPPLRRSVAAVVTTLARALRTASASARAGDAEGVYQALEIARSTDADLDAWRSAGDAAREITLLSPLRRSGRGEVMASRRALQPVDRAVRNLRVALRRTVVLAEHQAAGEPLLDMLDALAGALHTVPGALRDADGEGGRRLQAALDGVAAGLDPGRLTDGGLSETVVVAQLRSAVVDLYAVVGIDAREAASRLP